MRLFIKYLLFLILLSFFAYVIIPAPDFPIPLEGSIQSNEPADVETSLRRGYYLDYSREEVIKHYKNQFLKSPFFNITFPTYTLNYPPEEAQTLIRDQTKSTYLEEIVHPFRESIYVNGFEPVTEEDKIVIDGKVWRQKVIVRYSRNSFGVRIVIFLLTGLSVALVIFEIKKFFKKLNLKSKK